MRCVEQVLTPEIVALRLVGDLDLASAPEARTRLRQLVDDGWRRVVLDLDSCDFVDSVGLGVLIGVRRRLGQVEGAMVIANAAQLLRVFQTADLETLFQFADSIDMAAAELSTEILESTGTEPSEGGD